MSGLHADVDPDGLLEYSVVYTDRALNHMSARFGQVMRDLGDAMRRVYAADAVAVVPGGGTFAMEAVARQVGTGRRCLVLRHGWFSYRWTQILDAGAISSSATVLAARPAEAGDRPAYAPAPLSEVVGTIERERPDVVFAPHVETGAGMMLPADYLRGVADAAHAVGGLFVLDCIASGAMWVDMADAGVDILISAPQKGWTGSPCAGVVMMNAAAADRVAAATGSSFACDLGAWLRIMRAYEAGGHAYHATMPTDALVTFRDAIARTEAFGLEKARAAQQELGDRVRALLADRGFKSVTADGFTAPGVVVVYCDDPKMPARFAAEGVQIAAGVPLQCDEPADFSTFRIGLFGLDKLGHVERTVATLEATLDRVLG